LVKRLTLPCWPARRELRSAARRKGGERAVRRRIENTENIENIENTGLIKTESRKVR